MLTITDKCEPEILVSLNKPVHEWHVAHFPDRFRPDLENNLLTYFTKAISNESFFHFIAFSDSIPIGFIQAELRCQNESTFQLAQKLMYVHIVVVKNDFKRKGVSKLLFKKIKDIANQHDVKRIELDHWNGNEDAIAFIKMGFTPYRYYLSLDL